MTGVLTGTSGTNRTLTLAKYDNRPTDDPLLKPYYLTEHQITLLSAQVCTYACSAHLLQTDFPLLITHDDDTGC